MSARHDIQATGARAFTYNHPIVGPLELQPEMLAIVGTNGQILYLRHAEPGSPSKRALSRLAAMTRDDTVPESGGDTGVPAKPD